MLLVAFIELVKDLIKVRPKTVRNFIVFKTKPKEIEK